jgi:hypothetical protein
MVFNGTREDVMRKMKLTASQRRKIRITLQATHDVRLWRAPDDRLMLGK